MVLPELPTALSLALSFAVGHHRCIFQSELIHTAGLWIADSSRYLACQIFHRGHDGDAFPQPASLIIHTARLSLVWMATDLPPVSGICRRFIKTCLQVKIGLKSCSVNLALLWIFVFSIVFWKISFCLKHEKKTASGVRKKHKEKQDYILTPLTYIFLVQD